METQFGFAETEILLPRNLQLKVIDIKYIDIKRKEGEVIQHTIYEEKDIKFEKDKNTNVTVPYVDDKQNPGKSIYKSVLGTMLECEVVYYNMEPEPIKEQSPLIQSLKDKKQYFLNDQSNDIDASFREYITCAMKTLYYLTTTRKNVAFGDKILQGKTAESIYLNELYKLKKRSTTMVSRCELSNYS